MSTNNSFFAKSFVAKASTQKGIVTLKNDFGRTRLVSISPDNSVMAKETPFIRSAKDAEGNTILSSTVAKIRLPEGAIIAKMNARVTTVKDTDIVPEVGKENVVLRLNCHMLKTFSAGWLIGVKQDDGYHQSLVTWLVLSKEMLKAANAHFGFDITQPGCHLQLWNVMDGDVLGTITFGGKKEDQHMLASAPVEQEAVEQVKKPAAKKTAKKAAKKVATL